MSISSPGASPGSPIALLAGHPLTAPLLHAAHLIRSKDRPWPYGSAAWCVVTPAGDIV